MFNDDKYIAVSELLLKRGRMQPLEAMLYQRCYRFFLNCQKEGKDFYVDQLEAAQLFRVTRKTLRGWLGNLEQLGLLVRTGSTPTGNITYIIKDFTHVKGVLMNDDEYLELCKKYKREREANRERLQNHIKQVKADGDLEPMSLCKPSKAPEQVQDEPTYQEQETTPQEEIQELTEDEAITLLTEAANRCGYDWNIEGLLELCQSQGIEAAEQAMIQRIELAAAQDADEQYRPKWS